MDACLHTNQNDPWVSAVSVLRVIIWEADIPEKIASITSQLLWPSMCEKSAKQRTTFDKDWQQTLRKTETHTHTHTHTSTQAQAERQIKRLAGRLTKGQKLIGKKQQCPSAQIIEHYADIPASAFCCFAKKHHLRHRYRLLEKYIFWIILIFLNWKHWRIKNYFTHFLFRKTGIKFSNASFSKVLTLTMNFKWKLEIFSFCHHFSPSFFFFSVYSLLF